MTFEKGDIFLDLINDETIDYGIITGFDNGRYVMIWDWDGGSVITYELDDIESGRHPLITSIFREEFV